jgi:predicted alpha-1,6-mannanase (GH76 family)
VLNKHDIDEKVRFIAQSTHWRKLVNNATKYKPSALPTSPVTRRYSLGKLLNNAQKMKDEVNQWLVDEEREPISGGIWVRLVELLAVVSRFKNATEDIERDTFGTLSSVCGGLMLLQLVSQNIK